MPLSIHPQTKVGDVLNAYPELEDKLIGFVPAFAKLRNPILRRSVARIATLEHAAKIASIPVRDLVRFLREQTGQGDEEKSTATEPLPGLNQPKPHPQPTPAWVLKGKQMAAIDADSVLATGRHPLGDIHSQLAAMPPGGYLKLSSTFLPAPLFDAMRASGVSVHWQQTGPDAYETFLLPKQS